MSRRPRNRDDVIRRPETKSFILTSEFWVAAGAVAAVFIGGYVLDDITNSTAWRYGVWLAIAYIVSRGIAKAGSQRDYTGEPVPSGRNGYWQGDRDGHDDRDDRMWRGDGDRETISSSAGTTSARSPIAGSEDAPRPPA